MFQAFENYFQSGSFWKLYHHYLHANKMQVCENGDVMHTLYLCSLTCEMFRVEVRAQWAARAGVQCRLTPKCLPSGLACVSDAFCKTHTPLLFRYNTIQAYAFSQLNRILKAAYIQINEVNDARTIHILKCLQSRAKVWNHIFSEMHSLQINYCLTAMLRINLSRKMLLNDYRS